MNYRDVLTKHGYMTMLLYFQEKYCSKCPMRSRCSGAANDVENCKIFDQWFTEVHYIKQHLNHISLGENRWKEWYNNY